MFHKTKFHFTKFVKQLKLFELSHIFNFESYGVIRMIHQYDKNKLLQIFNNSFSFMPSKSLTLQSDFKGMFSFVEIKQLSIIASIFKFVLSKVNNK